IFSNLVVIKTLSPNHRMYNLYTKFVKILEICKQFSENLVNESANYGDKGYIGADVQLDLFETAHIRLECPYRLNQKDWKPTFIPFAKARKRIETIFSQLTDQFLVIRNYAKITNGLFARIIGKISALTILQYVNFINDKPIGRIKYALN
ncbi:transposase, partial [Prevotella pectinovora]|uniref:transposase n=2 Tax=Prevotella pectinovora TaxID=1602169 RepID=UPI001E57FF06